MRKDLLKRMPFASMRFVMGLVLALCSALPALAGITLDPTEVTLKVGETVTLKANLTDNDVNKTVSWSTSDKGIAWVLDGKVTAEKPGEVTITASVPRGTGGTTDATCKVTVVEAAPVYEWTLPATAEVEVGKTVVLRASDLPAGLFVDYKLKRATDDAIVTLVNGNYDEATLTGKKAGQVVVVAELKNKGQDVLDTKECEVTVKEAAPEYTYALAPSTLTLTVGETAQLNASSNNNQTLNGVEYSSSAATVAEVGKTTGLVKASAAGTATITVSFMGDDGSVLATRTCAVTVVAPAPVYEWTLPATAEVEVGKNVEVMADFSKVEGAAYVEATSSDPKIATVVANKEMNGVVVTGVAAGTATIKVSLYSKGSKEALDTKECVVTVKEAAPVYTWTLPETAQVLVGETVVLRATNLPKGLFVDYSLQRGTDDAFVTLVNGKYDEVTLTGKKAGQVVVVAELKNKDQQVFDTKELTVTVVAVPDYKIAATSASISVGKSVIVKPVKADGTFGYPAGTYGTFRLADDTKLATLEEKLDENFGYYAVVTGVAPGEVTVLSDLMEKNSTNVLTTAECKLQVEYVLNLSDTEVNAKVGGEPVMVYPVNVPAGTWVSFRLADEENGSKVITLDGDNFDEKTGTYYATVTGVGAGEATVIAELHPKSSDEVLATAQFNVVVSVSYSLELSAEALNATVGEPVIVRALDVPAGMHVIFSSSDDKVATVTSLWSKENGYHGRITGVAPGEVTIHAALCFKNVTSFTEGVAFAECKVTVKQNDPSIKFAEESYKVFKDETVTLEAIVADAPENFYIVWSSDNEEVATVGNSTGEVVGVSEGTATITAKLCKGTFEIASATCTVEVLAKPFPNSIILSTYEETLKVNETLTITAILRGPVDTDNLNDIIWTSLDESVVKAESLYDQETSLYFGRFTAMGVGKTTVIATWRKSATETLATAACEIEVVADGEQPVAPAIVLDATSAELTAGETVQIMATGTNVTDPIKFKSYNDAVATVDADGVVTAVAAGETTILVYTGNGTAPEAQAEFTVKVNPVPAVEVYTITLDATTASLKPGEVLGLKATVSANRPEGYYVSFRSSDTEVATVNATGAVTAVATGEAVIFAELCDKDNNVLAQARCLVTVEAVPVIRFDSETYGLTIGQEVDFTNNLILENVPTGYIVTWESSDPEVASVWRFGGMVEGLANGKTTITATVWTSFTETLGSATCEIVINDVTATPVPSISFATYMQTMKVTEKLDLEYVVKNAPEGAEVVFTSTNSDVASVDADGVVTALSYGQTVILANLVKDGESIAQTRCLVTVYNMITSLIVGPAVATIIEGEDYQLDCFVNDNIDPTEVISWYSANKATATVDQNGLVTAVAPGYVNIYAVSSNNVIGFCTVTVVKKNDVGGVEGVEGDAANVTVEGNNIIAPEGATVYNLNGVAVNPVNLTAGVYIVRLADGQTVKVVL